ncbi:acyclic terpene utilization AtuA family protein [Microbacterium marinilacus]|uniref:DUF1446 domain-containing protein n=1 Tax=Microbacterium marinilacus TaxID=415209 RepID=A0ABP7BPT2_9MICO|nr:acyclic terpene utilization AtuA family protein [Microbacterium marinilacus]MBY0690405.1 DUF1446 domain-containing protein [Microbacterium marinilacus]
MTRESRPPSAAARIGSGAGFAGDRFDAAHDLIRHGELDYIVFECLAERTLALAQRRRRQGETGYDPLLHERMRLMLPDAVSRGVRVITNAGAAEPMAAGEMIRSLAAELGLAITIGVVEGDDVLAELDSSSPTLEHGRPIAEHGVPISANAYLGAGPVVEALRRGADVVVTGRTADAALFLGAAMFHHDIDPGDAAFVANGTIMGHLLECAAQVTGGYFADGGRQHVPGLESLGFPIAEVAADGGFVVTKLPGSGGAVSRAVVTEQLLYEITDPHAYLTPDGAVDVTSVRISDDGDDRVAVRADRPAGPAPRTLKVSVGYAAGYAVEGEISYMGARHAERAELAASLLSTRLAPAGGERPAPAGGAALERLSGTLEDARGARYGCTRLRVAARAEDRAGADRIAREIGALYTNGPAGGGGIRTSIEQLIGIASTLIDRDAVEPRVTLLTEGAP